nr:hypothetical protein CFP56_58248 [Quercus suber]
MVLLHTLACRVGGGTHTSVGLMHSLTNTLPRDVFTRADERSGRTSRAGQQIIVQRRSALDRCMLKSNLMGQLIMEQNGLRPSRGNLLRNGIQKHVSYLTCISSACKHRKASTQVLYQGASDELERRFVMEDHSPAGKRLTAHLRNDGPIASLIEHNLPMGLRYRLVVKSTRTEAAQRHPLRCVMISMSDSAYQRAGLAPDLSNSRTCSPVKGTRLVSEQIRRLRWAIRQAKFALRFYARTMPFCPCLRRCFGPAPNLFCMSMGKSSLLHMAEFLHRRWHTLYMEARHTKTRDQKRSPCRLASSYRPYRSCEILIKA